jgi:hypothetical protein
MHLLITGFLPEESDDDSLKYMLAIPQEYESEVIRVLGWKSLAEESDGELLLTPEQVSYVSQTVQEKLPNDLDLFIGVRSS